jgi:hypothetical protein
MRKLIVTTFLTLDGVMQAPGGPEEDDSGFAHGGWSVNYWDEQMVEVMGEAMSTPFDLVLGRKTYDIFTAYWPHATDDAGARAITWMFAALNTVEPPILELATARFAEGDKPWAEERLPLVRDRIRDRLVQLSTHLGDADWLDGDFSAGDLMMVSVLLRLRPSGLLDELPKLAAYVARGEARPAYERAFAAQWAINAGHSQAVGHGRGQHDQTSDPEAGI